MPKARFPDKFGRYRLGLDGVLRQMRGRASSPTVAIVTLRPKQPCESQVLPSEPVQDLPEQVLSEPSGAPESREARPLPVAAEVRDIVAQANEADAAPTVARPRPTVRSKYGPGGCCIATTDNIPEIPFHLRRRNIDEATALLRRHAILVDVVDRNALVRTYRVSGKREPMLAEGVIEIACQHGFEVIQ